MKRIVFLVFIILTLFQVGVVVRAEGPTSNGLKPTATADPRLDKLDKALHKYTGTRLDEVVPSTSKNPMDLSKIVDAVLSVFIGKLKDNMGIAYKIIAIGILCGLLTAFTENLKGNVSGIAGFVCNASLAGFVAIGINSCLELGMGLIGTAGDFLKATFPVLVGLMTATGAPFSNMMVSPVLLFVSEIVASLVRETFLPLISISIAFSAIDAITDKKLLASIGKLLRTVCMWALGITMTVFVGVTSIQGIVGSTADGVAGKATKYAVSTLIPVAGKYLSDAADTVLGSLGIVRNTTGIGIVVGIIIICAVPLLQMLAIALIYKAAAVLAGPFVNDKFEDLVNDTSTAITQIAGMCAIVCVMFIIVLSTMLAAGNNVAALR